MPGLRGTFGLGVALLLAGGAFDVAPLSVAGAALTLLAIVLALWLLLARRGASVARSSIPARPVEGEPFRVVYRVRTGLLPMPGRIFDSLLPEALAASPAASRRPRRQFEVAAQGSVQRRGRRVLAAPELRFADPFGIGSATVAGRGESTTLVLPRIEPVLSPTGGQGPSAGELRRGAGDLAAFGLRDNPADPELDGLRPYRQGSSASRIYWPALARAGELVERRLTSGGGAAPLVVLDSTADDPSGTDGLDRAVRAAASLCLHLGRDGGCELMVANASRRLAIEPDLADWPEAHAWLALVEVGGVLPLRELPREGTIFWVAPAPPQTRGIPWGASSSVGGYLICAEPVGGASAVFTVAGCGGYPLGRGRGSAPAPGTSVAGAR